MAERADKLSPVSGKPLCIRRGTWWFIVPDVGPYGFGRTREQAWEHWCARMARPD